MLWHQALLPALLVLCPVWQGTADPFPGTDPFPTTDPAEVGLSSEGLGRIWTAVDEWVAAGDPVGAEVLIVKDGFTVFHEAFGWKDREREIPMELDTIARVRSMTKPFVGTSLLMLREEGRLTLDDTVATYLPPWDSEPSRQIVLRQLLTHTAGFEQPGYPDEPRSYADLRAMVDATGRAGPQGAPGARYGYSDADTATLGAIVAQLAGVPVEEFIQEGLFDPLGMTSSLCNLTQEDPRRERVASTYIARGDEFMRYWDNTRPQDMPFFRASGGIYSTPMDYARFLSLWMEGGSWNGDELLPVDVVAEALAGTPLSNGTYAWHWQLFPGLPQAEGSLPAFGHTGSDGTLAIALPAQRMMIFYFTQSRGGRTLRGFPDLVVQALDLNGRDR